MKRILPYALLFIVAAGISCSSPNDEGPGLFAPVVTGLRITSAVGPDQIAVWGNPGDLPADGSSSSGVSLSVPYPNPSDGACTIGYYLPLPGDQEVNLTVARARWAGEYSVDLAMARASMGTTPEVNPLLTLDHSQKHPGRYSRTWDARDETGKMVPGGFYRIYLKAGDVTLWRDVFIYRSKDEIPADLRAMMP